MKGSTIALDHVKGHAAAALIVDGRLEDFLIDGGQGGQPAPGAIFRAVCDRPLKGQGGMMLRLPGSGSAYLRHGKGLRAGQGLLVQVTGYAEPGKAVPVTARVLFKSRYAIITPDAPGLNISRRIRDEEERVRLHDLASEAMAGAGGTGLILRSSCEGAGEDLIADDIAAMLEVSQKIIADRDGGKPELLLDGPGAHALARREWPAPDQVAEDAGSFAAHNVPEMIDALLSARTELPNGAFAYVEPTHALVAIDVNTGPDTSFAAALKANIALARALPRILRTRGLGGQITIDFAPLARKDRRQLEQVLKAAFKRDTIETALVGWTPLGHFELQRKRERLSVVEVLKT